MDEPEERHLLDELYITKTCGKNILKEIKHGITGLLSRKLQIFIIKKKIHCLGYRIEYSKIIE